MGPQNQESDDVIPGMQLRFGSAVEEPVESHTLAVINEWTGSGQDV